MKRLFILTTLLFGGLFWGRAADTCRVALVQTQLLWGDVSANLRVAEEIIGLCQDCDLMIFPELFVSGCEMTKGTDRAAKQRNKDQVASRFSEIVDQMKNWAAQSGAMIIGSTIYKAEGKYYNRLLAVTPDGSFHHYDKYNCFKKGSFSPGNSQLVLDWKGHRIATYICYDLRFPEWSRNKGNYDTALYIANWPASRRTDWFSLLKERALENHAYIIGVNCQGTDPEGIYYAGDSRLLSPKGNAIAPLRTLNHEGTTILFFHF